MSEHGPEKPARDERTDEDPQARKNHRGAPSDAEKAKQREREMEEEGTENAA